MSGAFSRQGANPHPAVRLHRLDGLRGLAACGVAFLYHPQSLFAPAAMAALPQPFTWFRDWGWTLVDLFFLISGYIFAHVYLAGGGLPKAKVADFAVARVARLYPLHLLTLCLCAVLFAADPANTLPAFVASLFMLQDFYPLAVQSFNAPSWSISVECLCYALFVLAALGGERRVRQVALVAVVGAILHFALQGRAGGPWTSDDLSRGLLGFFLGQLMWLSRVQLERASTLMLAVLLLFGLTLDLGAASSLLPLCLIAWPSALLVALRWPVMGARPMRWLGDRSYAIYLLHMPVLKVIELSVGTVDGGWPVVMAWLAGFAALVLVLADGVFRFVEMPARKAIRAAWTSRWIGAATAI